MSIKKKDEDNPFNRIYSPEESSAKIVEDKTKKYIALGVIGVLLIITLFSTCYIIPTGEKGILLTFGAANSGVIDEGLHVKIPFVQKVIKMDARTQKYEADLTAASSDLQDVSTKIAINYHIVPEKAPEIYTTMGLSYRENVIYPFEQETNKAVTSQYTAEQLITRREEVREKMKLALADKLRERGIIIEDVSIVDFKFSESFSQAVEAKVTAEQSALAAKNKLEQIRYEGEQKVVTAKAEAEALTLLKQSATPETIELQRLKVQQMAIEKWSGVLPQVTGGAIPFISLSGNYSG
jgi:regulator of protease activity HflC (stomatin/prohibitin superfamily)